MSRRRVPPCGNPPHRLHEKCDRLHKGNRLRTLPNKTNTRHNPRCLARSGGSMQCRPIDWANKPGATNARMIIWMMGRGGRTVCAQMVLRAMLMPMTGMKTLLTRLWDPKVHPTTATNVLLFHMPSPGRHRSIDNVIAQPTTVSSTISTRASSCQWGPPSIPMNLQDAGTSVGDIGTPNEFIWFGCYKSGS